MAICVCSNAMLDCTFGAAPSTLMLIPMTTQTSNMPPATIMDFKPNVNIMPFGACAALSGAPCVPATAAPWAPGSPNVMIGNLPALNNVSKLMCSLGGVISVTFPGQATIMVP